MTLPLPSFNTNSSKGRSSFPSRRTKATTSGPVKAIHPAGGALPETCPPNEIWFYDRFSPYYEFTNFYPCSVKIDGKVWPTTEHYFQAQKFIGTPFEEHIRKLSTPREAFDFSREPKVQRWRRSDWNSVKDDVMKLALFEKFDQHSTLRQKLLGTGDKRLVEHTSNDAYWGDGGGKGKGQNRLGELLLEVRTKLKSKSKQVNSISSSRRLRRSNSLTALNTSSSSTKSYTSPILQRKPLRSNSPSPTKGSSPRSTFNGKSTWI